MLWPRVLCAHQYGTDYQRNSVRRFSRREALLCQLEGVGEPEDVAEAYLCFMRSEYTTGQIVVVDGGLLLV